MHVIEINDKFIISKSIYLLEQKTCPHEIQFILVEIFFSINDCMICNSHRYIK